MATPQFTTQESNIYLLLTTTKEKGHRPKLDFIAKVTLKVQEVASFRRFHLPAC